MRFSINIILSLFILIFISACSGGGSAPPPPTITSFSASSTTITTGNSVDLTAVFIADGTGSIDNSVGTVTSDTPVTVSPSTTTTYTLTVTKSDGSSETSALTVTVVGLNFLSILNENFDQVFQENQSDYTASVGFLAKSIQIKATSADTSASITVNDVAIGTDDLSQLITLAEGVEGADTIINIVVTQNTVSKPYTVTISRAGAKYFAEQAYIKASNTGTGDKFGYSVALSGDTLAVGAYLENSSTIGVGSTPDEAANEAGAVYVFERSGADWVQQAYIKASNTQSRDNFGISVTLSGDTLAVGATGEDSSTTGINSTPDEAAKGSGAVYVFIRSGTIWAQQAYIKASNTRGSDNFGISVALEGDALTVGANQEDSSTIGVGSTPDTAASSSGAVYVFTRVDNNWNEQAYIKPSNTQSFDNFGTSVAMSGDTLAVGAPEEDSSTIGVGSTPDELASNSGAVYVFSRTGTTWVQEAYIKASNTGTGDGFGYSVALSGDTLAVGAYFEDSSTTGINSTPDEDANDAAGAAYVFVRNGNSWEQQAYIKASNTQNSDLFGKSVALSGDVLAVGADGEDSSSTGINSTPDETASLSGAVYVFSRSGSSWTQQSYIKASNTGAGDRFGWSTAMSGDTLAVGAFDEDSSTTGVGSTPDEDASNSGAVYTFE